ncbi:alpha-L-arabinofuranosidase [Niastella koreensis]|uniref:non-reducing end alpha-L-arabinofuranosidase n=2 Tax=Niastella koreensis TaxID=354356 RepID=G8TBK0_NIAKG|nr:alpha-L-arabinofuranosidase C-terminal domain-containing protein [Niastella koreensis]AEV97110.1 alpha-L-arabinofuranosidase domain protein [Niastella koreensis GR20-10]OQP39204.1 alpha-L-arabinofuranosidase [Niastella koreensis]
MKQRFALVVLILTVFTTFSFSQVTHTLVVNAAQPKATIDKTMWGIFFEDINFGADGGIYAEMVKNRSFEFFKPMMGWTVNRKKFVEGELLVINSGEQNTRNPRFLRVTLNHAVKGDLGLTNEGFRGMGIKKGMRYDFSILYRQPEAHTKLHIELTDSTKRVVGDTVLSLTEAGDSWHKAAVSFHASETVAKGRLNIWFEGNGTVDLDMISLFPGDTWKNRPGGLRADMVQLLADMKPGFIRFPGGCIVEGFDLTNRYRWKNTVGPIEERQLMINRWNIEFPYRNAPDYFQTFGLGFFEYFQLAEDIGAEPLPILNCGMACQFNSAELVPMKDLDPFIQDALDLVEFANGDVNSKWGKVRAGMGHPAPFNLKMMGIGNENWGPQYVERLQAFQAAIKAKYPNIKLICSSGTDPNGDRFDYLNGELRKLNADFIDEHYYRKPEWFLQNARRYDNYPRTGSRVFGGEYASHVDKTVGSNRNTWLAALSEAAFMTGLERNADVVGMASYAPLFANVDGWQWAPDLIWVNNLQAYGTPDYQVQKLFSLNKGSQVVPITLNNDAVAGQDSLYASACIDAAAHELIIKVVNASDKAQTNNLQLDGVKKLAAQGKLLTMQSDLTAVNSFDSPTNVAPVESTIAIKNKKITLNTAPYSFSVLRVKLE